jgi:membrane-bound lytic murein transglycosylase D
MAIRSSFFLTIGCFWTILASGAATPAGAEPFSNALLVAHDDVRPAIHQDGLLPPPPDDPATFRPLKRAPREAGSPEAVRSPIPLDEAVAAWAAPSADPWADAVADAARVAAAWGPPLLGPYRIAAHPKVEHFLERFTGVHRQSFAVWLTRATGYLDMIRHVLLDNGLPEDLAFVAMIESGYNPLAVSRAGAKGMWQFMAATARRYGLRVDQWVDERLDPEKSTVAAAAYLRDLYNMFGSWSLAKAAYNAGENRIARAIRRTGSDDFWELARGPLLHRETKQFVPRIYAAVMIGRDPSRFGFELSEHRLPDVETVEVPPATNLRRLSQSSGLPYEELRTLNPILIRGVTPPGSPFTLKVPAGAGPTVMEALTRPRRARIVSGAGYPVHVVRSGETVTSIARRYGVRIGDVVAWNGLDHPDRIRAGERLRVGNVRVADRPGSARSR